MIYRETATKISTSIVDAQARMYSKITVDSQPFVSQDLSYGILSNLRYMTNELNKSLLDDSQLEIELQNDLAYVSTTMSKPDMTFNDGEEPSILIEFWDRSDPQNPIMKTATSSGITLNFSDEYLPHNINIKYYDVNGTKIADDDFVVSEINSIFDHGSVIEQYHKVLITFITTKYPNSFIKVSNIVYGIVYNWSSEDIGSTSSLLNAKIVEETDPLSNTLPINTCEFTVYDERQDFNIINPNDIYNTIEYDQSVLVYETIRIYDDNILQDEYTIFMGEFYIKEWKSNAEHEINFKCVNLVGLLEDSQFYLGKQYDGENSNVESVINEIMSCVKISTLHWDIDNDLKTDPIKGFLPLCSCREALQQVLFCIGAVIDCSRNTYIKIIKPNKSIKYNISDSNNLEFEQIQRNDPVSEVYIYKCFLDDGSENVKIFDSNLPVGNYDLTFNELIKYQYETSEYGYRVYTSPQVVDGDTSAVVWCEDEQRNVLSYLSHFILHVMAEAHFTITANTYSIRNFLLSSASNKNLKIKKSIQCKNNYLLDNFKVLSTPYNYATDTANRLLSYYSNPNTLETEIILNAYPDGDTTDAFTEKTGEWCLIKNKYGYKIIGNINKMEIDLTGGFLAKIRLNSVIQDESDYNYVCSNFYNSEYDQSELYSGDDIGLI